MKFEHWNSEAVWKVGLDLGTQVTAYQEAIAHAREDRIIGPRGVFIPSVAGYPRNQMFLAEERSKRLLIGEEALAQSESLSLSYPMQLEGERRYKVIADFASRLSWHMRNRHESARPWGVVACPAGTDEIELRKQRNALSQLFERTLMVEEPLLMAMAMFQKDESRSAILVDLGAHSTRVYLVAGRAPLAGHSFALPYGGRDVDAHLKQAIQKRYPDLVLTGESVRKIKESLGFVRPFTRPCMLEVTFGTAEKSLDVTELIRESCDTLVPIILKGIQSVTTQCPSDLIEKFLSNIYLLGGGAKISGLTERIQLELIRQGLDVAMVRRVKSPESVVATGALQWAVAANDQEWEIPLFAYKGEEDGFSAAI